MDGHSELPEANTSTVSKNGTVTATAVYGPLCVPVPIVTITVKGGKTFHIHKDILTKDSAYFEKALNGPFNEARTQSIDFDDITNEAFGIYLSVVYPTTLVKDVSLRNIWAFEKRRYPSWRSSLLLWKLADRFLNSRILIMAQSCLDQQLQILSVDGWLQIYKARSWPFIKGLVSALKDAFRCCEEQSIPFQERFVTALGNCPPQVFAECVEELDDDLKREVTKSFALRHADPAITAEKRKADDMKDAEESAKKQKRDG